MIVGFVEHEAGAVSERSLEMLTVARGVAEAAGEPLAAVAVGTGSAATAERLGAFGVAAVFAFEDGRLEASGTHRDLWQTSDTYRRLPILADATAVEEVAAGAD